MERKRVTVLLGLLLSGICILGGCTSKEERSARKAVEQELEKLQSSDSQTILDCIDAQDLLPSSEYTDEAAEEIADIFSLFYKDFSFEVKKISVEKDKDKGSAQTELTTIDACSLAKDYSLALLQKQIEMDASPGEVEFSLSDSCLLLKEKLETEDYDTETSEVSIPLEKESDTWKVVRTEELDSLLTGNFAGYMSDSRLLSPSEIVAAHFDTIGSFDSEQLKIYLSLDELVETDDTFSNSLAIAIARQIEKSFDYEITGEDQGENDAKVQVSITSPDFGTILSSYKRRLTRWLETSEALSAGVQGRRDKERELLISCIEENEDTVSDDIVIRLFNDGINWKIQMDSNIAEAVFGDIPSAIESIAEDIQ